MSVSKLFQETEIYSAYKLLGEIQNINSPTKNLNMMTSYIIQCNMVGILNLEIRT